MADRTQIHRAYSVASQIAQQNAIIREVIAKAMDVLRAPVPDTFLGRQTHEPFPKESEF